MTAVLPGHPALAPLAHAAKVLGIGLTTAYKLANEQGQLAPGVPVFRIRGCWKVRVAQLERFVSGEAVSA